MEQGRVRAAVHKGLQQRLHVDRGGAPAAEAKPAVGCRRAASVVVAENVRQPRERVYTGA